jgi:helicase
VLGALQGRQKTAENILQNVGREEPSMDGVDEVETETAAVADGNSKKADTATETDGDQSSLGDF